MTFIASWNANPKMLNHIGNRWTGAALMISSGRWILSSYLMELDGSMGPVGLQLRKDYHALQQVHLLIHKRTGVRSSRRVLSRFLKCTKHWSEPSASGYRETGDAYLVRPTSMNCAAIVFSNFNTIKFKGHWLGLVWCRLNLSWICRWELSSMLACLNIFPVSVF